MDSHPGKCSSFYIGRLSHLATPCDRVSVKSGAQTSRVVSVVIVVTSVSIDVAEIVAVVVISRPQPPPHRQ